jgi:3-deoxy-D-manno-octulosonate 8-phosphate phosphatase (KDO 8-P phosphatase)
MHSLLSPELNKRLANTKLLALDVDGVMTSGAVFFTALGDEIKAFNILDGQGIKSLLVSGIEVAIITGRNSPLTEKRARDLGIKHITQGREDKKVALFELCSTLGISMNEVAYMGDDLPDLSAIKSVNVGFTVPNAHPFIRKHADYCTTLKGGEGAVREVCDLILCAKGLIDAYYNAYLD